MRLVKTLQPASATRLNLLDRLIGVVAPAAALERGQARAKLDAASGQGGYNGGRRDRRMLRTWRPPADSADAAILPDLPDLRARTRDLARNMPVAAGAITTTVTNVVGGGLQLQPAIDRDVLGLTIDQAAAWQQRAKREWWLFCRTADIGRVQHLDDMQATVLRAVLESGDAFVARRFRPRPGDVYATRLQLVEADRVSNPNRAADNDIVAGGVEIDADGQHVAYHVTDKHPGALRPGQLKWSRLPARSAAGVPLVLHLFQRMRPDQTRGVPYLAPVIEAIKKIADYSDNEATAAVVTSMFTVFIEREAGDEPLIGEADSTTAADEVKLGQGAIVDLAPGEKANIANPGRPNPAFDGFVTAFLRQIGVALGLPYELLVKHFQSSYSASRGALEVAWQYFCVIREWFGRAFLQQVYEWFLEEAVALGRLDAPGFFDDPLRRQAWAGAEWIGAKKPSLDPLKDANADKTDIETGVKTREQVCIERTGGQWEDKTAQLGRETAARDAAGLSKPEPAPREAETDVSDGPESDPDDDAIEQDATA